MRRRSDSGQMTVELCIVFPVAIVIAVIAVNALLFFSECASFDRIARNAVITYAASPSTKDELPAVTAQVENAVKAEMGSEDVLCTATGSSEGTTSFSVTHAFTPTLFGLGLRTQVWGIPLPKLTHTTTLSLNMYSPKEQVVLHE